MDLLKRFTHSYVYVDRPSGERQSRAAAHRSGLPFRISIPSFPSCGDSSSILSVPLATDLEKWFLFNVTRVDIYPDLSLTVHFMLFWLRINTIALPLTLKSVWVWIINYMTTQIQEIHFSVGTFSLPPNKFLMSVTNILSVISLVFMTYKKNTPIVTL